MSGRFLKIAFIALALGCLCPLVSSAMALIGGVIFAAVWKNPFPRETKTWTPRLLQISIVGMGAGMNLGEVVAAGGHGIAYTVIGIVVALGIGAVLGRWLKNSETVSLLVSTGTAICGGSAIAAVGTAIGAAEIDMSVALITVFFLNSVALLVFPTIGHFLGLDQVQFGYWSALAIHDTSSVVGAAMQYGSEALKLATVVKLARALWIIPLTFAIGFFWSRRGTVKQKPKWPWFILYFLLAAAIVTWFPVLQGIGRDTNLAAKRLLVVTLFFIGSHIPPSAFKQKGGVMQRAAAQGLLLWIIVSVGSLAAIFWGWIR